MENGPPSASARPFVGRDRELAHLEAALLDAREGRGRLVLLAGEPGIGKTRLADELAARAGAAGATVLWGRGWEAGGAPPYWPWIQMARPILPAAPRELGAGAPFLAELLPELRDAHPEIPEPPPDLGPDEARLHLFEAVTTLFLDAAHRGPLLLLLDDLHLADQPSVLLLRYLAERTQRSPILILGAYREPETRRDPALADAVGALARLASVVRLSGLTDDEVGRLVAGVTDAAVPADVLAAIHRTTEGNPLFVSEIVRLLDTKGQLSEGALAAAPVPEGAQQAIAHRLDLLPVPVREALEVAAVLGREFDLPPLRGALGVSAAEAMEPLADAASVGLVEEDPDARFGYRFSHALIREALYRGVPFPRRMKLHRRVGEALETHYGANLEPHLAELAHHFSQAAPAGAVEEAVDYGERAAHRSVALFSYLEGAEQYRQALAALELASPVDERRRGSLLLELGNALNRAGDLAGAKEAFLRAADAARAVGDAELLGGAAIGYGRETHTSGAVDPQLVRLLEEARAALAGAEGPLLLNVTTRLSVELYYAEEPALQERRVQLASEAVAIARRLNDPDALRFAIEAQTLVAAGPDNVDERLAAGAEIVRLADASGRREGRQSGHLWRIAALLEKGEVAAAEREIEAYVGLAEELQQAAHLWYARMVTATGALLGGRFGEAERLMEEARQIGEIGRSEEAAEYFAVQRFTLLHEQRRVDDLLALEETFRSMAARSPGLPAFRAVLACIRAEAGRTAEARADVDALLAHGVEPLPRNLGYLACLSILAEACVAVDASEHAATLAEALLPYRDHHAVFDWSIASYGSVRRHIGLLASLLGRHDEAIHELEAAIASNEAAGARPYVARGWLALAQALAARGEPGDVERAVGAAVQAGSVGGQVEMDWLSAEAEALAAELGGVRESGKPAGAAVAGVFRREGEFWTLAFDGQRTRLKDSKGLRYLAVLLQHPGRDVHSLDVVAAVEGVAADGTTRAPAQEGLSAGAGDAGDVLDPQARAAYRRRLGDLREDVEEAEAMNDPERAARANEEIDFLSRELAAAVGLGGRGRKSGSAAERARLSVRRSVVTALDRIRRELPALGTHLDATIRTGIFCAYTPDPRVPIRWDA